MTNFNEVHLSKCLSFEHAFCIISLNPANDLDAFWTICPKVDGKINPPFQSAARNVPQWFRTVHKFRNDIVQQ